MTTNTNADDTTRTDRVMARAADADVEIDRDVVAEYYGDA